MVQTRTVGVEGKHADQLTTLLPCIHFVPSHVIVILPTVSQIPDLVDARYTLTMPS